jgi:hypothetical protein
MTMKTVTSLALAAGCALALAVPVAQAQTMGTQVLSTAPRFDMGDRTGWLAGRNNAESAQYDRLLEISPAFRHARARKECGPITDPQLRENCWATFAQYEPYMGSRMRTMASRTRTYPSAGAGYYPQEGLTGSSAGTMNSTTTYGSDMYGAGYGSSTPAWGNNYTTPRNAYGASRNLPGEYSTGMVQAPGAMPNYPGPRVSGPMSGGGGGGAGGGR